MITVHGVTHPGRVRTTNEDALLIDDDLGLFVVADGMGGHNAGDVASKLAVETIRAFMDRSRDGGECTWPFGVDGRLPLDANRPLTAVKLANRRVFRAADSNDDYTRMGTPVAETLVQDDRLMPCSCRRQPRVCLRQRRAIAAHRGRLLGSRGAWGVGVEERALRRQGRSSSAYRPPG